MKRQFFTDLILMLCRRGAVSEIARNLRLANVRQDNVAWLREFKKERDENNRRL